MATRATSTSRKMARPKIKSAASVKSGGLRKMKGFHPRKSSRSVKLGKQKLMDLEHRISADVGSFLVLLEEGSPEQVMHASQKAKTDFMKLAPDMQKLASQMGGTFPRLLGDFLESIDNILHTGINWIDDAKIKSCYTTTQKLEEALRTRKS